MIFTKWVYRLAALWGFAILLPMYALENRLNQDQPPAITHPEYYYGFIGTALAFQIVFVVIAQDPKKFRGLIPATVCEKAFFVFGLFVLALQGRFNSGMLAPAVVDSVFGCLFIAAYFKTRS